MSLLMPRVAHRGSALAPIAIILAGLWPARAEAQGPPILTDTPILLGLEGRGLRSFVRVVRRAQLVDDGRAVDDPQGSAVTTVTAPVIVPYNLFSERVQLGVVAPFARVASETGGSTTSSSG